MKWLKANSNNFNQVELVNENDEKYSVKLSPRAYTAEQSEDEEIQDDSNLEYLEVIDKGIQSTSKIRNHLLNLLQKYDSSDEVNVFYFGGKKYWIDVNKRNAIYHSCELFEADGKNTYELWIDDNPVNLPTHVIKTFLKDLENYAVSCYNITAEHAVNIKNLKTRESILSYDISKNYPTPISFDSYFTL